jgi:hypothetical protein
MRAILQCHYCYTQDLDMLLEHDWLSVHQYIYKIVMSIWDTMGVFVY